VMGVEPTNSWLATRRSTPELHTQRKENGQGMILHGPPGWLTLECISVPATTRGTDTRALTRDVRPTALPIELPPP
jgi:hypothetical protein